MKLPRDITGTELASTLKQLGYEIVRQTGSHIRLTTQQGGEHHQIYVWKPRYFSTGRKDRHDFSRCHRQYNLMIDCYPWNRP
ncbi:type II toxin-antitoxin system HicA family toxin [Thermosynechococcus sp. FA-CM-4201]